MLNIGSCPKHCVMKKDLTKVRVELVLALV